MYDLPRIAKVIGTMSIKGEESRDRPWRLSYWIEEPVERRVDEKLLEFLLNLRREKLLASFPVGAVFSGTSAGEGGMGPIKGGKAEREDQLKTSEILEKNCPESIPEDRGYFGPVWLMQPIPYFGEELTGDWIWEPKIDGWRMQIIKKEEGVEFWGRRLERKPNWTEKLKGVPKEGLSELPPGTILDAELYCEEGRRFIPSLFTPNPKGKPVVLVFDIIFYKGEFVGNLPLIKRKELLSSLQLKEPFFFLPGNRVDNLEWHLREAIFRGHEGIVVKEQKSPYLLGSDAPMATASWRKIKPR